MTDVRRANEQRRWVRLGRGLLLAAAVALAPACSEPNPPEHVTVEMGGRTFHLELAIGDEQIRRGLMHRESIAKDGGMLFAFPGMQRRSFWMKNTRIPLDLIYLDAGGRIVSIHTMDVPEAGTPEGDLKHYRSPWPAQFAIEVRAGTAERLGLEPGDRVALPRARLKRWAR